MCSVVGCDSGRRNVQRFKLPEDPEMRLEWVQFLFEVNGQRLKESSWTDITICSEHFADGCFVNVTGTVLLRSGAVPSLCVKSEPEEVKSEEVEPSQEPVETIDVACQCDPVETCDSPSSCSEESEVNPVAAQESPVPHDATDAFVSDYSQMLQKVVNIDIIREKAALLQMKGKYVVNENRLLQLFSPKCPLCHSQVKMEKFTYGLIIILNQQCLQCEYRNQWKSQVNASVPTASDQHLTEGVAVTPETPQTVSTDDNNSSITGVPELVADINDESDPMTKSKESSDGGDTDSDEDWSPVNEFLLHNKLHNDDSDEESENGDDDPDPLVSRHSQLCTDCGKFYNKWKPHTCVHKIKPYSCNICGKRCVSEVSLNSHSKVHDENYEHPCQYCHVAFKTKVDKINHEQTHLNQEKPYKCPDCSEAYAMNKERVVHLEDHRGPRQYKCNICRITLYCFTSLQRHMAVHTGVKPFKCSVCQRGFNQASHLKSHMRLHTGERPYKCQHCDKCFNHNVSLKSHVQRYHTPSSGQERKKVRLPTRTASQKYGVYTGAAGDSATSFSMLRFLNLLKKSDLKVGFPQRNSKCPPNVISETNRNPPGPNDISCLRFLGNVRLFIEMHLVCGQFSCLCSLCV
uniref:zinc finger protein 239-like isoform X2 n=1 Tax=Scatophagus argus TaxID=75038 RepID=UPI001ED7F8A0|nr:zinc finger protein 239-like isoform X2 [Scatophagus argus]